MHLIKQTAVLKEIVINYHFSRFVYVESWLSTLTVEQQS